MLARLILSAVAVGITAYFMDSVTIEPWWVTVIVAVVLGLINAVVRPAVKLLSLPLTLLTLGLFALVVKREFLDPRTIFQNAVTEFQFILNGCCLQLFSRANKEGSDFCPHALEFLPFITES